MSKTPESSIQDRLLHSLLGWVDIELDGVSEDQTTWQSGVYAVVDCVFSAQARYESTVLPMLLERLPARPGLADDSGLTFSAFIADVESFGDQPWEAYGAQVLNLQVLSGRRKVEVCHEIAGFFVGRGYENIGDLRSLGDTGLLKLILGPLQRSIRGMGPALAKYLAMLLGIESQVKYDTMLQRFFTQLSEQVEGVARLVRVEVAEAVMQEAATRLGTTPARLDFAIWRFMSGGGTVVLPDLGVVAKEAAGHPRAEVAADPRAGEGAAERRTADETAGRQEAGDGSIAAYNPFARRFRRVSYMELNSRQKESYNFHKLAAELADYGFTCMQLADDWEGADFLAVHYLGDSVLKVQLKGRLTIDAKYVGKDLWIAFPHGGEWYMVEHERLVEIIGECTTFLDSESWAKGWYSTAKPSKVLLDRLRPHRMSSSGAPSAEDLCQLEQIQERLHDLIRQRTAHLEGLEELELPELDLDLTEDVWFSVPGLFGGFKYTLDWTGDELALMVESESRINTGWEQRHRITARACELIDSGYMDQGFEVLPKD